VLIRLDLLKLSNLRVSAKENKTGVGENLQGHVYVSVV
jgi:hypothetical protein